MKMSCANLYANRTKMEAGDCLPLNMNAMRNTSISVKTALNFTLYRALIVNLLLTVAFMSEGILPIAKIKSSVQLVSKLQGMMMELTVVLLVIS